MLAAGYMLKSGFLILLHEPGIFVKKVKGISLSLRPCSYNKGRINRFIRRQSHKKSGKRRTAVYYMYVENSGIIKY